MKIPNLNIFKQYSHTPVLRNCLECPKVRSFARIERDMFDCSKMQNFKEIETSVFNPYTNIMIFGNFKINLSRPAELTFRKFSSDSARNKQITLRYNPENKATIYKRIKTKDGGIKKQKLDVNVLTSNDGEWRTTYHFFTPNLKKEIGYITIGDYSTLKKVNPYEFMNEKYFNNALFADYKKQGIIGDRIKIDYLQNWDDKRYSGIGALGDRLSVEYCLRNKLPLNIISEADFNSHIAHFLRGKRYFIPPKDSAAGEFFQKRYGTRNPNAIIKNLLKESNGNRIDTSGWGLLPMYMPKETAEKYVKSALESPIIKDFKPIG